jgi:hypothetical protein
MITITGLKKLIGTMKLVNIRPSNRTEVIVRFTIQTSIDKSGCWLWTGTKSHNGYGQMKVNKRLTSPHRFIYAYFFGDIPDGLEIDHKCRTRACCNPRHLRAITHKENQSVLIRNTCKYGHTFELMANGKKFCRECRNRAGREFRARQ